MEKGTLSTRFQTRVQIIGDPGHQLDDRSLENCSSCDNTTDAEVLDELRWLPTDLVLVVVVGFRREFSVPDMCMTTTMTRSNHSLTSNDT